MAVNAKGWFPLADRYEDSRGVIEDLIGPVDSITQITTVKDAVRGNHVHHHTTQWTYVVIGKLRIVSKGQKVDVGPGGIVVHEPGDPHAWIALEDTTCLVFTRGPRSGANYESDTVRLDEPLIA